MIFISLTSRRVVVGVEFHPRQVIAEIVTGDANGARAAVSVEDAVAGFRVAGQEPLVEGNGFLRWMDAPILKRLSP